MVADFLEISEEYGLKPVTLFYTAEGRTEWKTYFPGCAPGQCARLAETGLKYQQVQAEEARKFDGASSGVPKRRIVITRARLNDVSYQARLQVDFDAWARVQVYTVMMEREALTRGEQQWAIRNSRGKRTHPIAVAAYFNNVSLGRDAFHQGGPRLDGDSVKGF